MTHCRGLVLVLALLLGIAVTACGNDLADSGLERYEEDGLSVQYPSVDWKKEELKDADKKDGLRLLVSGPGGEGEQLPIRVALYRQGDDYDSDRQYGKDIASRRLSDLNEGRLIADQKANVGDSPDGDWLVLIDYTYDAKSGPDIPGRSIDVLARSGAEQFRLTLTGPRVGLDDQEVQSIRRSFGVP